MSGSRYESLASLFEKILRSVNSGVSIEEALAKHGTNQEVVDELLDSSGATTGQVLESDGTNVSWVTPPTASTTAEGRVELATDTEAQAGTDTSRAITPDTLRDALVSGIVVDTSTGATSYDITGLPSWVRRITIGHALTSLSGTAGYLVQIGDSGGIETTGYASASAAVNAGGQSYTASTSGFIAAVGAAANDLSGLHILILVDPSNNTWVASHANDTDTAGSCGGGTKSLSATLDRVRITTTNGTDTFDAGSINILYE